MDLPKAMNPNDEECRRLRDYWLWFLILGVAIMMVGLAAISAPFLFTLTSVYVFGIMLLVGGIVQIVNAFLARSWQAFFVHVLIGVLNFVVGALMIEHPLQAILFFTLLLAVSFFVGGIARLIYGALNSFPGRGWVLLNGFITAVLGVMIWRQWPESSLWVIGLFLGIDLVFSGWSWVMLGFLVKNVVPANSPPEVQTESTAS
jgi:uncharacterized membrane protein HdeD (DUF308 family)